MAEPQLHTEISKHAEKVHAITVELGKNNKESAIVKIGELLGALASDIPIVGKLSGAAAGAAFKNSAYGQMDAALKAAKTEEERQQQLDLIGEMMEALIGQALIQIARINGMVRDELVEELGGLREDLEDFRADFKQRLKAAEGQIRVDLQLVEDGGIGVRVRSGAAKGVWIKKQQVRGAGSVGIEL